VRIFKTIIAFISTWIGQKRSFTKYKEYYVFWPVQVRSKTYHLSSSTPEQWYC
jgi:hypothetical protein